MPTYTVTLTEEQAAALSAIVAGLNVARAAAGARPLTADEYLSSVLATHANAWVDHAGTTAARAAWQTLGDPEKAQVARLLGVTPTRLGAVLGRP